MTDVWNAEVFKRVLGPRDDIDYRFDLTKTLAEGETLQPTFTVEVAEGAEDYGLLIDNVSYIRPYVTFTASVDVLEQDNEAFIGQGVLVPLELWTETDNDPERVRLKTAYMRIARR